MHPEREKEGGRCTEQESADCNEKYSALIGQSCRMMYLGARRLKKILVEEVRRGNIQRNHQGGNS